MNFRLIFVVTNLKQEKNKTEFADEEIANLDTHHVL